MGVCESRPNSILITFRLSIGGEYKFIANLNESFKYILNKFISEQCPNFNHKIRIALCKDRKVDFNKKLIENDIQENDCILLLVDDIISSDLISNIENEKNNENKNYIIAEFKINSSYEVQIINSYEEVHRNRKWGLLPNHSIYYSLNENFKNEDEIKECEIEI